ncbi:hypothetical protein KR018_005979 [Drosophila ironensis]|nr:hypothetical protein KR018_005979 [Drosophila ironensis]
MFSLSALNLFFFNSLIFYLARKIERIIKAPTSPVIAWHSIPIFGKLMAPQVRLNQQAVESPMEFNDVLWIVNFYLNLLMLLPAVCQRRYVSLLLGAILMWNFYVFERLLMYLVSFVWSLWWSDLSLAHYSTIIICGLLMNSLHLLMIFNALKLQSNCLAEFLPQIRSLNQAQQEVKP